MTACYSATRLANMRLGAVALCVAACVVAVAAEWGARSPATAFSPTGWWKRARKHDLGLGIAMSISTSSRETLASSLQSNSSCIGGGSEGAGTSFKILSDTVTYRGWRSMRRKEVAMPNGRVASFDIVSQGAPSVIVFVWDTKTRTSTLIREYHPGVDRMLHGTVAGIYEAEKHDSLMSCARFELEEEAQLRSDHWVPLLDSDKAVPFDKYADTVFHPFLALDCTPVLNPRPLDDEEYIVIERGVGYKRIMELICDGSMNVPCGYVCMLAFEKLRSMGYPL